MLGMVPVSREIVRGRLKRHFKMTEKRGYSSVGALVMARAQKRLAEDSQDGELALNAISLERRALEAIKAASQNWTRLSQRKRYPNRRHFPRV
jgi:hypothetical protein